MDSFKARAKDKNSGLRFVSPALAAKDASSMGYLARLRKASPSVIASSMRVRTILELPFELGNRRVGRNHVFDY